MKKIIFTLFFLLILISFSKPAFAQKTLENCPYGLNYGGGGRPDIIVSDSQHDYLLKNIKKAGVCWVRIWLLWWDIENRPGIYNWEKYDYIIKKAHQQNLKILLTVHKTPQFYSNRPERETFYNCPPKDTAAFKKFISEAAKRYKEYVSIWQIGNEIYDNDCWQEADIYPEMLNSAVSIIRRHSPEAEFAAASISYYPGLGLEKFIKDWFSKTRENLNYTVIHVHRPYHPQVKDVINQVKNILQEINVDLPIIIGETSFNIKDNPQIDPFDQFKKRITTILENNVQKVFWFKHITGPWGPGLFEKTDNTYVKTPLFNQYKELITESGWYLENKINLSAGINLITLRYSSSPPLQCHFQQKIDNYFWTNITAQILPPGAYFIKCQEPVTWVP